MSEETIEREGDELGWHVISGTHLLAELRRVESGESADLIFAELWANAEHHDVDESNPA